MTSDEWSPWVWGGVRHLLFYKELNLKPILNFRIRKNQTCFKTVFMKILGCWLEADCWPCEPEELVKNKLFVPNTFVIPSERVINYLASGVNLYGARTMLFCQITSEQIIGAPAILSDGTFFWTASYSFYITKGMVLIDDDFLAHITSNNFEIPDFDRYETKAQLKKR